MKNYIILGGGIAGLTAAAAIRERDARGKITVLAGERELPYSRPMLSKASLAGMEPFELPIFDESWYGDNRVELIRGARITALDTAGKTVTADGAIFPYDKCIYALGAYNFIPPFPGADKENVLSVRTACDMRRIRSAAAAAQSAVVIGGGVIGIETALGLSAYGLKVTVLEALPYLMPRLIDERTSDELIRRLPAIEVHTAVKIRAIEGEGKAEAVSLEDGRVFPCGLVIVSCGVRANSAIAAAAGLECGRAVKADRHMQTSAPDVYACGDACEVDSFNAALYCEAIAQGRVAGLNAAGADETLGAYDTSLVLNSPEVALFAAGDLGKNQGTEYTVTDEDTGADGAFAVNPRCAKAHIRKYYSGGRLVGASIVGNLGAMPAVKAEIMNGGEAL